MVIYLDVVLLENICINSIILFTTGLITKSKCRMFRIVAAATIRSNVCNRQIFNKQ